MRYCKYFIAKFNEAAALHLDFSDICVSQLHVVGCDESGHRPPEAFMAMARCECTLRSDAHFKLCVDRQYDARMTSSVSRQLRRGALRLNLCQFAGSSPRGQISPEPTEPQTSCILMHWGGRSSLPYTSKHTSSSPLFWSSVLLAVCSLLYELWRAAPTNNALVINHCWFDVKSFW